MVNARKSLAWQAETVGRNMDINCDLGEDSESKQDNWRESFHLVGGYINMN